MQTLTQCASEDFHLHFTSLKRDSNDLLLTYLEPSYQSRAWVQLDYEGLFSGRNVWEGKASTIVVSSRVTPWVSMLILAVSILGTHTDQTATKDEKKARGSQEKLEAS